ncbi:hypothetical protein [Massilia timonae]|uniref:hypothetical protein n=1 Tax=Massilia timonae TaxID=47229 RepID=UPI0028D84312|nr:hypothetical protein [Massilia timonae]
MRNDFEEDLDEPDMMVEGVRLAGHEAGYPPLLRHPPEGGLVAQVRLPARRPATVAAA